MGGKSEWKQVHYGHRCARRTAEMCTRAFDNMPNVETGCDAWLQIYFTDCHYSLHISQQPPCCRLLVAGDRPVVPPGPLSPGGPLKSPIETLEYFGFLSVHDITIKTNRSQ